MLIRQDLSIVTVFKTTWKTDILIILTCVITYLIHEYVVPNAVQIPATLATLLGTAIAFFIGFNNNQAYSRWWEARKIWGGLVNDCRSWARNIMCYTSASASSQEELEHIRKRLILRQIGFVYALKATLRKDQDEYFERFLSVEDLTKVRQETNIANAILTLNAVDLQKLSDEHAMSEFRFMQLNEMITAFTNHMGKSERIRNTIFPTSYIYFTRLFIWVLVVFSTLILVDLIGIWSIIISWIIGFVFHVTHQNGMGLMDPFDEIATGIPLNQISRTIEINLLQMLGDNVIPEQIQPVNNEYIL